jgi:hypothetical protein
MSILRIWHLDKKTSVTEMTQYDTSAGPMGLNTRKIDYVPALYIGVAGRRNV